MTTATTRTAAVSDNGLSRYTELLQVQQAFYFRLDTEVKVKFVFSHINEKNQEVWDRIEQPMRTLTYGSHVPHADVPLTGEALVQCFRQWAGGHLHWDIQKAAHACGYHTDGAVSKQHLRQFRSALSAACGDRGAKSVVRHNRTARRAAPAMRRRNAPALQLVRIERAR